MAETYAQILQSGLQAAYDALQTKDSNVLYFCTDTGKIYKGTIDFSNSVVVAASKPATPIAGKVYVLADTNTVEVYVGGKWQVVSYPTATTVTAASDDVHVASAKAVYDAIQAAVEDLAGSADTVKAIEAGTADGKIKVTKGDGSSTEFAVPGAVTTPTWDASARKLTLPVTGGTAVEVNIGKDIFIDPTADNKYNPETGNIEIHLNDGKGEAGEGTLISIPAEALVDIYTGGTTTSAVATVGEDNVISVSVVVDPVEGNALVLTKDGLKVDLSAYAKTADVNTATGALQTAVEAAQGKADANEAAIAVLNGGATTDGSVAKAVADAKATLDAADTALAGRVSTLEADNTTNKANIATNTANIAALAGAACTWGTF